MGDDAAPDDPRAVARRWPLGRRQRVWLAFIRRRWGRVAAVAAIAAGVIGIVGHLLGGVAGLWEFYRAAAHPPSPASAVAAGQARPFRSIAVLPLAPAGTPASAELAATLTDEFTVAASRALRDGLVTAGGLAARYRGGVQDPRRVGTELNVRYVVTGAVRERNGASELAIDLADGVDGAHLWSARAVIAGDPTHAVARLANDLRDAILAATSKEAQSLPAPQREAWRLVLESELLPDTVESDAEAQRLFERALAVDPRFVPALLNLQRVLWRRAQNEPAERVMIVRRFGEVSQRAVTVAPMDPRAWNWRAYALHWQKNWAGALAASDEALRLDPLRADSLAVRASLLILVGRADEALAVLDRAAALRADTVDVDIWRCVAYELLARDRDAVVACERAAAAWNYWVILAHVAAAYANLNERGHAALWAQRTRDAYPQASLARIRDLGPTDHPDFVAAAAHFRDGLRKAGIPEH